MLLAAAGSCVACLLLAGAASFLLALIASALLGVFTLVPYLLPPYVAQVTPRDRLGRVLGTLLAGQFSGILLARTASGLLAQLLSWRLIYLLAALLMALMTLLFRLGLPQQPPSQPLSYWQLQQSQLRLWHQHGTLRLACLRLGLLFGCFVAHQTQVLSLDPAARNRLLTWLVLGSYLSAALSSLLLGLRPPAGLRPG